MYKGEFELPQPHVSEENGAEMLVVPFDPHSLSFVQKGILVRGLIDVGCGVLSVNYPDGTNYTYPTGFFSVVRELSKPEQNSALRNVLTCLELSADASIQLKIIPPLSVNES